MRCGVFTHKTSMNRTNSMLARIAHTYQTFVWKLTRPSRIFFPCTDTRLDIWPYSGCDLSERGRERERQRERRGRITRKRGFHGGGFSQISAAVAVYPRAGKEIRRSIIFAITARVSLCVAVTCGLTKNDGSCNARSFRFAKGGCKMQKNVMYIQRPIKSVLGCV